MAVRVTQVAVEVFRNYTASADSSVRVTQVAVEVFRDDTTVITITGSAGIPSAEAFGSGGSVYHSINGSAGIASEEAFGSGGSVGFVLVGSVGIVSIEAFGLGIVYEQLIDGRAIAGIVSAESFGSGGSVTGAITGASGIVSEEAFGLGIVYGQLIDGRAVAGIVSAEAFGSGGAVAGPITGSSGIASEEAFGAPGIVSGAITGASGIASVEAFGSGGSVTGAITGSAGIASEEAFGSGGYLATIVGSKGIPSLEQFGTTGALVTGIVGLSYMGISSAEAFGTTGAVIQFTTEKSNYVVRINGSTVDAEVDSISVDRQLNFLAAASFQIVDDTGAYFPDIGQEVLIWFYDEDSSTWKKIFAGQIESLRTIKTAGLVSGTEITHEVRCTDYARALSRRILRKKFPQAQFGTLQKILKNISTNYLEPEGITWVDQGDPGVTIADLEFSADPLDEALDKLRELTGWDWQIDFDKNFYFFDRPNSTTAAPWDITEALTETYSDLRVVRDRGLYRNRVYVKANFTRTTSLITLSYTQPTNAWIDGFYVFYNGEFLTDYRYFGQIARIVDIRVDGSPVTWWVPDDGDSPPADWDYQVIWGSRFGYQLDLIWNLLGKPGAHPGPGSVLTYTFEVINDLPEPIVVDNDSEIAARKAVEGGTGIYAAVEEVQDIDDRDLLIEYANKLLDRFSVMSVEAQARTRKFGLEPGQRMPLNLPSWNVTGETGTIERVSLREEKRIVLWHEVLVSNQIQQRDALAAMRRLIRRIRKPANKQEHVITFVLAQDQLPFTVPGLVTGTTITNTYIIRRAITLRDVVAKFNVPPVGADIILDIKADASSIFAVPIHYTPAGGQQIYKEFATPPLTLYEGQELTIDCSQVGSSTPGKNGTIEVRGWV